MAYDGEGLAAHDTKIGDDIHEGVDVLPMEAEFFFPLGGHERYVPAPDRQADVRATKHISRFFDAVRDANPTWATDADRHALNLFMVRVLFCLFAEDVGIFDAELFTSALNRSTQVDGTDLGTFLTGAFAHMKDEPAKRAKGTHGWSKLPWVNGGLFEEDTAMPRRPPARSRSLRFRAGSTPRPPRGRSRSFRSLAARSYEAWGQPLAKPIVGCIAVKKRPGGGWLGHVGIVVGANASQIILLGGNQADQVSIAAFPRAQFTAFRWPANIAVPKGLVLPTSIAGARSGVSEA